MTISLMLAVAYFAMAEIVIVKSFMVQAFKVLKSDSDKIKAKKV
jgi:hypothetical protein